MTMFFVGTVTGDTRYLPVSEHQTGNFLTLRNPVTSLDPEGIKRIKVHPVKCPRCMLTVMVRPDDEVCPVCGTSLAKSPKQRSVI
jgi:hypothetical protein